MITDALLQLSSAQTIATTAVSSNTIDLGQARDVQSGKSNVLVVAVDTTATAAGAATLDFELIVSAFSDLSSPTILGKLMNIPKADLVVGRPVIVLPVPRLTLQAQNMGLRYMGLRYIVNSGPLLTGAFSAWIAPTAQVATASKVYPMGYVVY